MICDLMQSSRMEAGGWVVGSVTVCVIGIQRGRPGRALGA